MADTSVSLPTVSVSMGMRFMEKVVLISQDAIGRIDARAAGASDASMREGAFDGRQS